MSIKLDVFRRRNEIDSQDVKLGKILGLTYIGITGTARKWIS